MLKLAQKDLIMSSIKIVSPESLGLDSKVLSNTRSYLEEQYLNPGKIRWNLNPSSKKRRGCLS